MYVRIELLVYLRSLHNEEGIKQLFIYYRRAEK